MPATVECGPRRGLEFRREIPHSPVTGDPLLHRGREPPPPPRLMKLQHQGHARLDGRGCWFHADGLYILQSYVGAAGSGGGPLRSLHGNGCYEAWPGEEEKEMPRPPLYGGEEVGSAWIADRALVRRGSPNSAKSLRRAVIAVWR
jgi:hypothetical protein